MGNGAMKAGSVEEGGCDSSLSLLIFEGKAAAGVVGGAAARMMCWKAAWKCCLDCWC